MKILYDAHIHNKNKENGGFLIGLEGKPYFEGVLSNNQVLSLHNPQSHYYSFYYVSLAEVSKVIDHPLLKYHPRREEYTPEHVAKSIQINKPKAVIIDTLNEPYWIPYDYWRVAKSALDTPIVMAHAGGYLINDFLKICHFQENVWLDFALTQTLLARLGNNEEGLPYVTQAIKYALHSPFRERILMSSDYPFYDQDEVFDFYKDYHALLNNNFIRFTEMI